MTGGVRPVGVLGGTFDPIHLAHLAIADHAREELDLDLVLFVPAGIPPHKQDRIITAPRHRVAMVELGIAGHPCFRLSRLEVDRPGPSYAVDTLREISRDSSAQGRPDPVFILSVDALSGFDGWRDPEGILDLCRVAVVPRSGYRKPGRAWAAEHFPGREDRFLFLDGPDLGHSASQIRHLVGQDRSIRYLVPREVEAYIARNHLYPPELWTRD
jgi:nicotinate-nucleotide adenylyltransferase